MKKINILTKTLILLVAISLGSCKKTLDAILVNPNSATPASADVDLYLGYVELNFNGFFQNVSDDGAQLSRQQYWTGPLYRNNYSPASFDGIWSTAYSSIINNANALIPLAQSQNKFIQSGIAKVLKAYTLGTLVDSFNDVPFTEAELGVSNPNPKADGAATIYVAVQALLDDAIKDFGKTGAAAATADLFYGGNAANWITCAKTMKLKFFMQTRLVDNTAAANIKALLVENNLIKTAAQDFVFKYGTNYDTPNSRHPHYNASYQATGGGGEYMSNYMMWEVGSQKYGGTMTVNGGAVLTTGDPRMRYYFYRESLDYSWANSQTCPCFPNSQFGTSTFPAWYPAVPTVTPYCVVGKGYLGRDHGDNSGAPPDGNYRTVYGVYPAGGQFDANQAAIVTLNMGGNGAGISPIWLSSYTALLEAEAALKLGLTDAGDARTLLQTGVNASITKVMGFPAAISVTTPTAFTPTATQVTNYVNLVLNNYDAAATTDAKLNIVMTEYHIAAFGNGIEAYNNLRRTGMPFNLQPAVAVANPGFFMRSFYYPSVYVNRNLNAAPQKAPGDAVNKVFWDNNPDTFIK